MRPNFDLRKKVVRWAIAAVIVIDLALAGLNWQMSRTPHAPEGELESLRIQRDLMTADVRRGDQIRRDLPTVEEQCDSFMRDQFRPVGSGYSGLISDLGSIANKAGLNADAITFTQHKPDAHGLVEVDIGESIEGSYPSVVQFLDGLEHSHSFYVLDGLSLSSSRQSTLKLSLQLRTFFRS
jgi:Tfp pilus assembly protein PilO